MIDSRLQRINMVESQVRTSDVTNRRIIRAMLDVPREAFAPEPVRAMAYMDDALQVQPPPGGKEVRYLLAPRIFAKLVQLAEIEPESVVLDVGCATGYSTAVLAKIAARVVAVECDADLAARAARTLRELGIGNALVVEAALSVGAPAGGPYDAILLNGAVPEAPDALLDQLKEGGRLVGVVANGHMGCGRVWQRSGKAFGTRSAFDAGAPLLPGFVRQGGFVF
jgi:protein-L-isoaspartate(D-aspartate) O-methyltransferase